MICSTPSRCSACSPPSRASSAPLPLTSPSSSTATTTSTAPPPPSCSRPPSNASLGQGHPPMSLTTSPTASAKATACRREILETAAQAGVRLVISVDTGIRAFAAADEAAALGLDLIVTDHHLPESAMGIPHALAVLNPNQADCPYPCKHLCGAAVAFKLAQALLAALTATTPIALAPHQNSSPPSSSCSPSPPSPTPFRSLGENRVIVALGLANCATPSSPACARSCRSRKSTPPPARSPPPTSASASLHASTPPAAWTSPATSSSSSSPATPRAPATSPKSSNASTTIAAPPKPPCSRTSSPASRSPSFAEAFSPMRHPRRPDWHRGVLGILASRVVDRTGRPALVLTHEDGEAHGSGRSIPGFHLLDAIESSPRSLHPLRRPRPRRRLLAALRSRRSAAHAPLRLGRRASL